MTARERAEPVDPDVGLPVPVPGQGPVVAAVALGGAVGAAARWSAGLLWHTAPTGFPWTTLGINLLGSLLLPVVVVLATDVWPRRRLLRPLLGTGVLGGFTTFSTLAVDAQHRLAAGHAGTALLDVLATLVAGTALTWCSLVWARRVLVRP